MLRLTTLLLVLVALLAGSVYSSTTVVDCDYDAVHSSCGAECAPSGTCEFDRCRMCCEERDCPSYFEQLCEQNGNIYNYDGGGHCEAEGEGMLNACESDDICTASAFTAGLVLYSLV